MARGTDANCKLRYRLACQAADGYANAGFTVVLQDVVIGELLREFLDGIQTRPRYLVVLTPRPEVISNRLGGAHHRSTSSTTSCTRSARGAGCGWTTPICRPRETVDAILGRLDEARFD